MQKKKILMASSNSWNSIFQVGTHHLAKEFIKLGYEVGFVSNPISPFHLLFGKEKSKRFELYYKGGFEKEGLWAYVPGALLTPQNKRWLSSMWLHKNWSKITFPQVQQKVKKKGFDQVDLLYFDTALQSFWLDTIQAKKTLFRIPDQNKGFQNIASAQLQMERDLAKKVDLVVCSAKNLTKGLEAKRVEYVPNGVNFAHFSKNGTLPHEYRNLPGPIAVYAGAIDYWLDYELIKNLALELPYFSFVFIGPVKKNPFSGIKNIHLLGPKPYSEIPNYLKYASVGIIPFDVEKFPELIHSVNPLKLYEYMASGIPVVSSRWEEIEEIGSPAFLCSNFKEFKSSLLRAIEHPHPTLYQSFAEKLDWSHKAQKILSLL